MGALPSNFKERMGALPPGFAGLPRDISGQKKAQEAC